MIIHKGKKITISADHDLAEKSDGNSVRKMNFYPQRDVAAIAGEIDELTAWQIFHDVAASSSNLKTPISPQHILMDEDVFILSEWSESKDPIFNAPEGYEPVWALGASVFYVFLGCHVFQGLGGKGQTISAPVPTLRRELPELSKLVSRCLDYTPQNRPSMKEILNVASENIERCTKSKTEFPPLRNVENKILTADEIDAYWPEEMHL